MLLVGDPLMTRLNIIVEGVTEERFIRDVLTPYLALRNVFVSVRCVETSRHGDKIYRGGITSYEKAKRDIIRWLNYDTAAYLTTMFDFYALPNTFPGHAEAYTFVDPYQKAYKIETAMAVDINSTRFIPYIQLHEFEALLFSSPNAIDEWMSLFNQGGRSAHLSAIMESVETPEHINHGPTTAPSKRLMDIYSAYDKVFIGSGSAGDIGIDQIREKCLRFNGWIDHLCRLGTPSL